MNYAKTLALFLLLIGVSTFGWLSTGSKSLAIFGNTVIIEPQLTECFSTNQTDTDRTPSQVLLEEKEEVEDECSFVPLELNGVSTEICFSLTLKHSNRKTSFQGNSFPSSVPIWLAKRCLLI